MGWIRYETANTAPLRLIPRVSAQSDASWNLAPSHLKGVECAMAETKKIYDFLLEKIHNPIGVCALMGNLYTESLLEHVCLQRTYAEKMKLSAQKYTEMFDQVTDLPSGHTGAGRKAFGHTQKNAENLLAT